MFDTMRHIKSEVSTINVGLAASMGSLLLVGGTKGIIALGPHPTYMAPELSPHGSCQRCQKQASPKLPTEPQLQSTHSAPYGRQSQQRFST